MVRKWGLPQELEPELEREGVHDSIGIISLLYLCNASASLSCGRVGPVAELVDAADLKSVVRMDVPVRVRPGLPNIFLILISVCAP